MTLSFDILLGYLSARKNPYFYAIVKELGKDCDIGILKLPFEKRQRTKKMDAFILAELKKAGAEVVDYDRNLSINCNYFALAYLPSKEKNLWGLGKIVRSNRCGVCFSIGQGPLFEMPTDLLVHDILVPDRRAFEFFLKHPQNKGTALTVEKIYENFRVIQVGSPFRSRSYFIKEDIDYVVAVPTLLSMPEIRDKIAFLVETHRLLDQIGDLRSVYLKRHNARDAHNSFGDFSYLREMISGRLHYKFLRKAYKLFGERVERRYLGALYNGLLDRVKDISEVVEYPDLCIEMFLPRVKKGIITSFSNTIWHALLSGVPVFSTLEDSAKTLGGTPLYRQQFGVPYCKGRLFFDPVHFSKVDSSVRETDYIETVRSIFAESMKGK